jgi:hypothetical protein
MNRVDRKQVNNRNAREKLCSTQPAMEPASPTAVSLPDDAFASLPVAAVLSRIRAQKSSPLPNQRLPAAILLALEDSIKEDLETPGAHWAGLVGVLERMQGTRIEDETLQAVVYLFAAVFPRLPLPAVLILSRQKY